MKEKIVTALQTIESNGGPVSVIIVFIFQTCTQKNI